jgi:hypothetical protein
MNFRLLPVILSLPFLALAQTEGEWKSLFDGKSFSGWSQANGSAPGPGWTIEEGVMHLHGEGGNLLSEAEYTSFELEWEWKIVEGGNNGLKYWVAPVGPKKEMLGLEYQMIDDAKHADALRGGPRTTACIYDIVDTTPDKPVKTPGEWNTSRVVVKGGKIQHWLNGKLVVEADTAAPAWQEALAKSKFKGKAGFAPGKGRIMLTDHHDETWLRAIRIRELQGAAQ